MPDGKKYATHDFGFRIYRGDHDSGSTSTCFGLNGEELSTAVICKRGMVIRPPIKPPRITDYLKPYVLKMNFTNKYVSAQVIHTETATVASSASSQEKILRSSFDSTGDVSAASMIGKLLGERLLLKGIPAVSLHLKKEQKYHGKVKAMVDSLTNTGVKLL